ncbi:MAG: DNA polymerase/3'-5' exonuclease PolX [Saprospiraceae bacterium]|nr:DNA polymerase/3'-5' exonuclease PolX [Saprospiraceae bacterium]
MTNKELARNFDLLSGLMELHDENPFKIRSYQNAYNVIRQMDHSLIDLEFDDLVKIKGIGKSIANDIIQLKTSSRISYLEELLDKTPSGILDIMKIKGIGPKKVRSLWQDLGVESLGELEYAIQENRLSLLKGFGEKTQESILQQIEFLNSNKGKLLYYKAQFISQELIKILKIKFPDSTFEPTGELRRMMPVISKIEILTDLHPDRIRSLDYPEIAVEENEIVFNNFRISFIYCEKENFGSTLFITTGPEQFVDKLKISNAVDENQIFELNSFPYIMPHLRDNPGITEKASIASIGELVNLEDIKGVLHNHTFWSDGSDKTLDMALFYRDLGYEYMLVSDHSKSAFYANGVKEMDILKYLEEINEADAKLDNFRIFSGIESDILGDGSLDYNDKTLALFDVVIASVHSGLRMDKNNATVRLLKAISNPYTRILGHATGRILLSREGYPLDFDRIFEACMQYDVVIELNANPLRLDIDWQYIQKIQEMGIKISINPDAHSRFEVKYMDYGVIIAQKGGLLRKNCLNAEDVNGFENWVRKRK